MGYGFQGFEFSHEGVKRVVGLLEGFVHAIASAPREFLYLRLPEINEYIIKKKKEKKKRPCSTFVSMVMSWKAILLSLLTSTLFQTQRYSSHDSLTYSIHIY